MFYAGTLGYFAMYQGMSGLQAQTAGVNHLLMPSFGTYGVAARVNYFFGFPRTMSAGGIVMDIGKLSTTTTPKNGNNAERFGFVLQAGMLSSALEHTVPEQMFSTATQKAEAVSTVKLLNLAAQQGIPILHITPANSTTTMPSLQLAPKVIAEIQTAVAVGKEVIVHQNNITAFGWTGAGYAVLDPVAGDAAWRISEVGNGGIAILQGASVGLMLLSIILSAGTTSILMLPLLILTALYFLHWKQSIPSDQIGFVNRCFIAGFLYSMALVMLFIGSLAFIHGAAWVAAIEGMTTFAMGAAGAAVGSVNILTKIVGGVPSLADCSGGN